MDTKTEQAECTYDLSHAWPAEHASWNNGAMDSLRVDPHLAPATRAISARTPWATTRRRDIPFYYDLAENFTICDNYFCSVLGPTHPNRLMAISGTLDPAGVAGGPIIVTNSDTSEPTRGPAHGPRCPKCCRKQRHVEVLQPVRVRSTSPARRSSSARTCCCTSTSTPTPIRRRPLYQNAFSYYGPNVTAGSPTNPSPNDFAADVANNTLPQVSWIISPDGYDEHPPAPAALGEWYTQQILDTLTSNPEVWASTVLFIMYDENDGFFDHVPPPTRSGRHRRGVPDRRSAAVARRVASPAPWAWVSGSR